MIIGAEAGPASAPTGNYFNGILDDIRIYDTSLSANNVAELAGTRLTVEGLEAMSTTADIVLQADNTITLDLQGDTLTLDDDRSITLQTTNGNISTASAGSIDTNRTAAGGSITFTAGGDINLNHTLGLTTSGGDITFNSPVNLAADQNWNAGAGSVSFSGTVDGGNDLTIAANDFSFGGRIGGSTALNDVSLTSATTMSLPSISANSITATSTADDIDGAGGLVTSGGDITLSAANDLDLSSIGMITGGGNIDLDAGQDVTINTWIDTDAGSLTVDAGRDIFLTANDLTTGLVGYWNFDEGAGGTAADSSGNGNDGTLTNGPIWSADTPFGVGNSIDFDGNDDFVDISSVSISGSALTLSAWAKTRQDNGASEWTGIVGGDTVSSNQNTLGQDDDNRKIWGEIQTSTGNKYLGNNANGELGLNNWEQVMLVYDGSQLKAYVNGIETDSMAATGTLADWAAGWPKIGHGYNNVTSYFNGFIDNVRIYNTALSASEIAKLQAPQVTWQTGAVTLNSGRNVSFDMNGEALTASGDVAIRADGFTDVSGFTAPGTGNVSFDQATAGNSLDIGSGGSGNVVLADALITTLKNNYAQYSFGRTDGGAIRNYTAAWEDPVTFLTNGNFTNALATTSDDTILVRAGGYVILDDDMATTSATAHALVLSAGDDFLNNAGSDALSATNSRWLVYSDEPTNNTRDGLLPSASEFNKTYAANAPATIGAGNRFVYSTATQPTLVYQVGDDTVEYGDAYSGTPSLTYSSGLVGDDTLLNISLTGSAASSTTYNAGDNAGTYKCGNL